jgi:hypothetical protein
MEIPTFYLFDALGTNSQYVARWKPRIEMLMNDKTLRFLNNSVAYLQAIHTRVRKDWASFSLNPAVSIPAARRLLLSVALVFPLGLGLQAAKAQASGTNPIPVRPILFVHGIGEDASAWGLGSGSGVRGQVINALSSEPGYSNSSDYDLYFDGTNVRLSTAAVATSADPIVAGSIPCDARSGNIPCDARFFSIRFFGWAGLASAFDPSTVLGISIITKAFELSKVIKAITAATYVKDVILVAHSMGALDSRAYLEGIGSTVAPCTVAHCGFAEGLVPYTNDVAQVITVDGANAGANAAYLSLLPEASLNEQELSPGSAVIKTLNYDPTYIDVNGDPVSANNLPANVTALISYFADQTWDMCALSLLPICGSDGVVQTDSQSIQAPLANHPSTFAQDLPANSYLSTDPSITTDPNCWNSLEMLHLLPCLADTHGNTPLPSSILYSTIIPDIQGVFTQINFQVFDASGQEYTGPISLTLTGPGNTSTPVKDPLAPLVGPEVPVSATVPYNLTLKSGGPAGAGAPTITGKDSYGNTCSPCYIKPGNWAIKFNVNFNAATATKPAAVTQPATGLMGDGATLAASVNPNGAATTAWFEWGSTSALGNVTPKQLIPTGTSAVAFTANITGLTSNSTYYYRIDASNSAGTSNGSTVPFSTLSTLPKPNLLTPQSGSVNVSTTPVFTWSSVPNATSYRIVVASNSGALPTVPTSGACGTGCVIDDTPVGTSYTPAAGLLVAGTQYFWEVHARSPLQYGSWSTISNFTAGAPSVSGVSINPSGTISSGSSTNITVSLNAPAPPTGVLVNLLSTSTAAYPVPASITVPVGAIGASAVVQTGSVSALTPLTVTANYNGSQTTTLTVAPEKATTTTTAATSITGDSATLNGAIKPNLSHGSAMFLWGTDPTMNSYTQSCSGTNCPLVTPNSTSQAFNFSLTGLSNSTNYYFRMVFSDSDSGYMQYGPILSFITVQGPVVTTTSATSIGSSGATLNGTVNPLGANGYTWFEWGTDPTMNAITPSCYSTALAPNSTVQTFNCPIGNLPSSTLFYFRIGAYDSDTGSYRYGLIQSFTTLATSVTTGAATSITSFSATLNGTANPEGATGIADFQFSADSTFATFAYTPSVTLTANTTAQTITASTTTGSWCCYLGNPVPPLSSGTTYYYRTFFQNGGNGETKYGLVQQFKTAVTPVTTGSATGITSFSATLNGTANPEGATGQAYFQFSADSTFATYAYTPSVTLTANTTAQTITASTTTGSWCCYLGNPVPPLSSGTTYYYRTFFQNGGNGETKYGPTKSLTTFQPTPTITWVTPAAITYGTALGTTQLDATANVAGSFVYSPKAGTVLKAGTYTLNVTFTPTDKADYNTATASVSLTVTQATPKITWPTPAAIVYGTALTTTQLDAEVTVPGTLAYNFPLGTVLPAGKQTLIATFKPTDSADYTTATATVSISVLPIAAAPTFSPAGGTYASAQTVTISDATSGAVIYYTTSGTTPTISSTRYTGPVKVSTSETLNAIAVVTNYGQSPMGSAIYTIGAPQANLSVASVAFGNQPVNTASAIKTVTLTNTGDAALNIDDIDVTGASNSSFFVTDNCGTSVVAGKSCSILVLFYPTAKGAATASVAITDNAGNSPQSIALSGTGILSTPTINWPTPAAITFGTALSATQLDATSTVAGTLVYSPKLGTVLTAGPQTLSVTFTPTNTAAYTTATTTVTLTVNKAALTVTANNLSKVYGAALPTLTDTITGFVNGETAAKAVTGAAKLSTTATATSAVGTYPITVAAGTLVSTNYSFKFVNGTLTVTPLGTVATPTFTPVAGTYNKAQSVTIADVTPGTTIYYTTNGTTPTTSSTKYTGAISVSSTETIEAIAVATGFTNSAVASASYTLQAGLPTFTPVAGTYNKAQSVTIADVTPGATIYYTTNGTAPTTSSTKYTGAISVSSTETIEAIAVATGYANSAVATAKYTLVVATPTFSPAAGTYTSAPTVTLSDTTPGATIYYTTNGTTPTTSSTKYTGAISVSSTETIEAIAVATGYANSAVASASYTLQAGLPTFTPVAGTYNKAQSVTIADVTPGATIYYTTNGTAPTTSSTKYTGAISVSSTETIEAIAVATGYANSAVATAKYTLVVATPTVISTIPVNGAMNVPVNQVLTATFSEAMNPATITTTTFGVKGPSGTAVAGTVTYTGTVAKFTPAANLASGTVYTATITTGATDLAGTPLAANYVWTFKTL